MICVAFNYNTARKFAKLSTTIRVFTKYRKSAQQALGNNELKKEGERVYPLTRVSLTRARSFLRPNTGYVQYGLFNRDDVVDNNRQQSIVSFFFSFLLPMSNAPKALIKTFVK